MRCHDGFLYNEIIHHTKAYQVFKVVLNKQGAAEPRPSGSASLSHTTLNCISVTHSLTVAARLSHVLFHHFTNPMLCLVPVTRCKNELIKCAVTGDRH